MTQVRQHQAQRIFEATVARYQMYPAYRDSGVEWLGEIPEHWVTKRLKYIATVKARLGWKGLKASEYVDEGYILLSTPNIKQEYIDFENVNYITVERYLESPEIMLQEGDVLLAKDGSTLGIASVVRKLPAPATVNSSIAVIRIAGELEPNFLYRYFMGSFIQNMIQIKKDGQGVPHLFQSDINEFNVIIPPYAEQRAISAFLDRQTTKIDGLIAKKRELIAILHEQRSAIISHAVTKGLNPAAQMKDSGIEWIDKIPAHWQVSRLKFVADIRGGVAKGRKFEGVKTVQLPYLRVANVQAGHLDLSDMAEIEVTVSEIERYSLKVGDVLMNEGGDYDKLGRGAVWQGQIEPCLHQNHVFAVRPHQQCLSNWITTLTLADYARFYLMINSKQSTNLASISSRNLGELPVILPPITEREQILQHIEDETKHIDGLTAKAEETIERLQEYRTALISAAVTGKIDVREGW